MFAYIAERRRINSQVLSDTIARVTASCVSFSEAREGERFAPPRGDFKDGRRGRETRMAQVQAVLRPGLAV